MTALYTPRIADYLRRLLTLRLVDPPSLYFQTRLMNVKGLMGLTSVSERKTTYRQTVRGCVVVRPRLFCFHSTKLTLTKIS